MPPPLFDILRRVPALGRTWFLGEDYRIVDATPSGRRVLQDILRVAGAGQQIFVPGVPEDSHAAARAYRIAQRIADMLGLDEAELVRRARATDQTLGETS